MNAKKLRKTIYVAFFVSVSAQIHFDFLTEGFIVALSSVVMAIFIYCYEDLTPGYIICLSGIIAPLIRLASEAVTGQTLLHAAFIVLPDMFFFFAYAAVYTLIYRLLIRAPKSIRNFPYAIFFSDFLANMTEMGARSILTEQNLYSLRIVAYLILIALCRTAIIPIVVFGRQAENCAKCLARGRKVAVSGRIQTGSYTNREGQKVYTTDVIANNVEFLSSRGEDTHRPGDQQIPPQQESPVQEAPPEFGDWADDDIPF